MLAAAAPATRPTPDDEIAKIKAIDHNTLSMMYYNGKIIDEDKRKKSTVVGIVLGTFAGLVTAYAFTR